MLGMCAGVQMSDRGAAAMGHADEAVQFRCGAHGRNVCAFPRVAVTIVGNGRAPVASAIEADHPAT
ncbi:hypothetical protein ASE08_17930 [Rhizobacter sp. Root16D2]|nr:hypothetical protein ASC88_07970 [Rhizobacter sp. Root29]KQW15226.1 hypothetical protein ASC98_13945 [Rhizobacter sp. Root1238]KRB24390.1 hypothetical protein ASE08_17930 [Rhizobacter sp. Root16D2]